jgi:ABC-type multidrug transport system ATPase subunit
MLGGRGVIEIRSVSKHYGRVRALDDVSLAAGRGEVVLLLGANGAGKSTLVRSMLGITPYEGEIRVGGLDPLRQGKAVRSQVGYMPQSGGLHLDLSVKETMRFYCDLRGSSSQTAEQLLGQVGLEHSMDTEVGELSGGMRQRLGFALAMLSDPPVLILDEPTASLDAQSRELLVGRVRSLAERGKTILLSTHSEEQLLATCDRAVTLESGRVIADRRLGQEGSGGQQASGNGNGNGTGAGK